MLAGSSPIWAKRANVSRRLSPASRSMRVVSVAMKAQLPELDEARTQNLKMCVLQKRCSPYDTTLIRLWGWFLLAWPTPNQSKTGSPGLELRAAAAIARNRFGDRPKNSLKSTCCFQCPTPGDGHTHGQAWIHLLRSSPEILYRTGYLSTPVHLDAALWKNHLCGFYPNRNQACR